MVLTGILLAVAAGLLWNMSGIVNSICARKKFDIYSYLLTNVIFSAIFTGVIAASTGNKVFLRENMLFIAVVVLSGIFNTSGALLMQRALQLGHHGIVFLISQSAPVVPFIAGMLFLGDTPTVQKISGVMLILLGMFLAALPELSARKTMGKLEPKTGLFQALLAFGCLGISHTLLALPSLMTLPPGTGKYRTFFLYCGCSCLILTVIGIRGRTQKISFDRRLLVIGIIAAVINVCSMGIFFKSMDFLASVKAVGLGSPLATSASLVGFTLYSWFYLREKRHPAAVCGLVCICAGAVAASL